MNSLKNIPDAFSECFFVNWRNMFAPEKRKKSYRTFLFDQKRPSPQVLQWLVTSRPLQSAYLGFHPVTTETAPSHPTTCTLKRALTTGTATKMTSIHLTDRCQSPSVIFLRTRNTNSMYEPSIQLEKEHQVEHREWLERLAQVTVTNNSSLDLLSVFVLIYMTKSFDSHRASTVISYLRFARAGHARLWHLVGDARVKLACEMNFVRSAVILDTCFINSGV